MVDPTQDDRVAREADRVELHVTRSKRELRRVTKAIEEFATAHALPPRVAGTLALAFEEALTNVIFHGFDDGIDGTGAGQVASIRVTIERRGAAVIATLRDPGRPFDPTTHCVEALPGSLDEAQPGGLGIRILRSLVDRLDYRREDGFNLLEMELAL